MLSRLGNYFKITAVYHTQVGKTSIARKCCSNNKFCNLHDATHLSVLSYKRTNAAHGDDIWKAQISDVSKRKANYMAAVGEVAQLFRLIR